MTKAIRWSNEELAAYRKRLEQVEKLDKPAPARANKYAAQKVENASGKFDSKKEARRWAELEMLQAEGRISDLKRQVPFVLAPAVRLEGEARMKPAIRYFADFTYVENGMLVVVDCKSAITRKLPAYRIKAHLMKSVLGLDIKEV